VCLLLTDRCLAICAANVDEPLDVPDVAVEDVLMTQRKGVTRGANLV
jgi:hypothetical protein